MVMHAFRGVVYFLRRPALWKEVAFPLLLTVAFSVLAAFLIFSRTYSRQENWLNDKVPKRLAEILAVCIVLTEIFVSTIAYGVVCIDYFQDKIFAFVLQDRGLGAMLENQTHDSTTVRVCTSYFVSRGVLGLVSLPLHLIPILGSVIYAWLHGVVVAWEYHLFYFELRGFGFKQQQRWIGQRKLQYSSFGMQALLLQMIPLVGPLFIFSNTCGAALLAVKMQRQQVLEGVDEEMALLDPSQADGRGGQGYIRGELRV